MVGHHALQPHARAQERKRTESQWVRPTQSTSSLRRERSEPALMSVDRAQRASESEQGLHDSSKDEPAASVGIKVEVAAQASEAEPTEETADEE